jgi:acetylornithine deacetylase
MTVGRISGGVWTSSQPAALQVQVRFGLGLAWSPAEAQARIEAAVAAAAPSVEVEWEAFRAPAFCWDTSSPVASLLAATHEEIAGSVPGFAGWTATTDARYVEGALSYGPLAGNLHGADEWVDVESLETIAQVVAVTASRWLGTE